MKLPLDLGQSLIQMQREEENEREKFSPLNSSKFIRRQLHKAQGYCISVFKGTVTGEIWGQAPSWHSKWLFLPPPPPKPEQRRGMHFSYCQPLATPSPSLALAPGSACFPRVREPPESTKTGPGPEEVGRMLSGCQVQVSGRVPRIQACGFSQGKSHSPLWLREANKLRAASSPGPGQECPGPHLWCCQWLFSSPLCSEETKIKHCAPGPAWFLPRQKPQSEEKTFHRFLKVYYVPGTVYTDPTLDA